MFTFCYRELGRYVSKIMMFFTSFVVLLVLVSCDGGFDVYGKIVDKDGKPIEGCTIDLYTVSGEKWHGPYKINSDFWEHFTVAPSFLGSKYKVVINCSGYKKFEKAVNNKWGAADLGTIKLEKDSNVASQDGHL